MSALKSRLRYGSKWAAARILRMLPEAIRARVLPTPFRYDASMSLPLPPQLKGAARLLVLPVNYAGQGQRWAQAVSTHVPDAAAVNLVVRTSSDFSHPADVVVPLGMYVASTRWQRAMRQVVNEHFSHVMVEAEKQPFGALLDESVQLQIDELRSAGLKVLMLCHGTDIRLPSRHAADHPDSPFGEGGANHYSGLEAVAAGNQALLKRLRLPVLVSTPGLLSDVPSATWLPVVVDTELWANDMQPFLRSVPVVAHAPSSAALKGSAFIDPVLERLQSEGLIEYRRVSGVPFDQVPALYRDADIVVDQLLLGDYGVAACEAMAAGRVVVAHVDAGVRSHIESASGVSLPIVEATASTLEEVLRTLLSDFDSARAHAKAGIEFVNEVHDGRFAAEVLKPFLT
ncbi:glycosyltransferase [Rhodoglobus sp.]